MKEEINASQCERDLLDILLDEEDKENIRMKDKDGQVIEFEQVAVIAHNQEIYCILHPVTPISGVEEDQALVFKVVERDGEAALDIENDELTAIAVFEKYYDLLEE
jgi:hypothetical protein